MQQDDGKASATEQVRRPAWQPIRIISFGIKEMNETEEDEIVISVVFITKSFYALMPEYSVALPTREQFVQ